MTFRNLTYETAHRLFVILGRGMPNKLTLSSISQNGHVTQYSVTNSGQMTQFLVADHTAYTCYLCAATYAPRMLSSV